MRLRDAHLIVNEQCPKYDEVVRWSILHRCFKRAVPTYIMYIISKRRKKIFHSVENRSNRRLVHLSRPKRVIAVGKQFDGADVLLVRIRFTAD